MKWNVIHGLSAVLCSIGSAGCASSGLFQSGARPPQLISTWVDSALATPTDTVAWVLRENGDDRTLRIHVNTDSSGRATRTSTERHYAMWWVSGDLTDTLRRRFCSSPRPGRFGSTCYSFHIDTIAATDTSPLYRRLLVVGYAGTTHVRNRVLIERRP